MAQTQSPITPPPPIENICLALPAYNEEAAIAPLIRAAAKVLMGEGVEWSIVVVDDGSADATAAIVEAEAARFNRADGPVCVRLVRHGKNRGLGPAILTCLKAGIEAAGDGASAEDLRRHLVVCMDADMTHPPETIPAMRQAVDAGADLVIASRFQPGSRQVGVPPLRGLMSWGARKLFRYYLGLPGVKDYTCGFRGMRASLLAEGFAKFGETGLITRSGFACTDELLVHLAMLRPVIREVPFILRYDQKVGRSKMNLKVTIIETIKLLRTHRKQLREQPKVR